MKTLIMILLFSLTLISCEIDYSFNNPVCCKAELRDSEENIIRYEIIEEHNCHTNHPYYIGEIVDFSHCD